MRDSRSSKSPPKRKHSRYVYIALFLSVLFLSCNSDRNKTLLTKLDAKRTGINFTNNVKDNKEFNILDYLYFYNGGGVSVGDINNDGLPDLYFSGNQSKNRLYLNKGNFEFEDITKKAGVGGSADEWSTGVTMADVNGDGYLDIYVCQVNHLNKKGHNLLYINNGDTTFTERSEEYNLDFKGTSTQAAFLDYDRDGDLDLYLMNHSIHSEDSFKKSAYRKVDAPEVGDKLYRNNGNFFEDVTHEAGIYSSALGYGLGIAVSDVNKDGWPDIYIGNDFHEDDYLYINNGDGTFTEKLQRMVGHTSRSSMGNDIADFNNDGYSDILSLDMLPESIHRYRTSGGPDDEKVSRVKKRFGYSPQYSRNTLQLNRGFGNDGHPLFSEIGLYSGISATDWSWAGLFVDLDNDSWKDIFITNGILRRPNNLDYVHYVSQPRTQKILSKADMERQLKILDKMPRAKNSNYIFENNGDLTFSDVSNDWGIGGPDLSNGAAYGDLDNDGDIDLVVNNINSNVSVYKNNADTISENNYLDIRLSSSSNNSTGVGSKVFVYADGKTLYRELTPTRGFQSSVSHELHFGLGSSKQVDSLLVIWPDGQFQRLQEVATNQKLVLNKDEADGSYQYGDHRSNEALFTEVTSRFEIDFTHRENDFVDFKRQPLIPHKLSTQGPALAVADVNGDGLDDFFVGGAHHQAGKLFIRQPDGDFLAAEQQTFRQDERKEDVDATFFDADGDGDQDLYVVSGGGEFDVGQEPLQDRLYLNDGEGNFSRSPDALPKMRSDGCCVAPADYDRDGDVDLFVGSRSVPGSYGKSPKSYLLENNGKGTFRDVTPEKAPELRTSGMITDAVWADIYRGNEKELIVVGEWMPVTVFHNSNDSLQHETEEMGLEKTNGFWKSIHASDFDDDGDLDLVVGNLGENSIFKVDDDKPLELFINDFDNDGASDPIIAEHRKSDLYTWARRNELLTQIPGLQEKIPTYEAYSDMVISDVFNKNKLQKSDRKRAHTLKSIYLENKEDRNFRIRSLPKKSQFSPIQSIISRDFNNDEKEDILIGENFFGSDNKQGRYDAGYGLLLRGDGTGHFEAESIADSGFIVRGEARDIHVIRGEGFDPIVIIARNDAPLQLYKPRY